MPASADLSLAEALLPAAIEASLAILDVRAGHFQVERKADASPVTEADRRAEAILLAALARFAPDMPVVAEEEVSAGRIPDTGEDFFLVDALDGTKEFVRGGDDYTVNLALIRKGAPVLGIVAAPERRQLWFGTAADGAFLAAFDSADRQPIHVRRPAGPLEIVASSSHRNAETDAFIARFPGARICAIGSSLKFCLLAEGRADLYPRLGPTSQWDTAAGDAVLRAAGGCVLELDGSPLRYGPRDGEGAQRFLNPSFVATAGVDPFAT